MPGRNLVKIYADEAHYHIYNRGVNKATVFHDSADYAVFLNLLKRYLSKQPAKDSKGRNYPWFGHRIELLAFCLMPNHYHLLIYQDDRTAMTELIRALSTSYGMYVNKKYRRVGPVFQSRFRASLVDNQTYLDHISRYIHLNPGKAKYKEWQASSYRYYSEDNYPEWLYPQKILEMFDNKEEYLGFTSSYEELHENLEILKHELANM